MLAKTGLLDRARIDFQALLDAEPYLKTRFSLWRPVKIEIGFMAPQQGGRWHLPYVVCCRLFGWVQDEVQVS